MQGLTWSQYQMHLDGGLESYPISAISDVQLTSVINHPAMSMVLDNRWRASDVDIRVGWQISDIHSDIESTSSGIHLLPTSVIHIICPRPDYSIIHHLSVVRHPELSSRHLDGRYRRHGCWRTNPNAMFYVKHDWKWDEKTLTQIINNVYHESFLFKFVHVKVLIHRMINNEDRSSKQGRSNSTPSGHPQMIFDSWYMKN